MSLIPVMGWFDTETKQSFQSSLAPNPENLDQPWYKSQIHVPMVDLNFQILKDDQGNPRGKLPTRSNPTDAGLDLYAAEDVVLLPIMVGAMYPNGVYTKHQALVSTGLAVEVPPGLGFFIWDRSGLAVKHSIHRLAGVVDSAFRGEVKVALINLSSSEYQIRKGDRIAQGILSPIILARPCQVDKLSDTGRGVGGFGVPEDNGIIQISWGKIKAKKGNFS